MHIKKVFLHWLPLAKKIIISGVPAAAQQNYHLPTETSSEGQDS
jgi:hypothetical protein